MYHKSLKYLSVTASIIGLLSVNIAFADLQQLVPPSPSSTPPTVSPVTKSWPIGCYDFTSNLWSGMKGITVRHLQYFLLKEGFDIPQQEFGVYGGGTGNAVIEFKQKYASEILLPAKLTHGNGNVDRRTRLKLNSLYSCNVVPITQVIDSYKLNIAPTPPSVSIQANLAVTNTTLDSNGIGVTFCNKGTSDLLTAPFRVRLNGIDRDFEVTGAQKAGACETDTIPYGTWGLTYDPGATYTVVGLIDPNGYYKTSGVQYPIGASNVLLVPSNPCFHP